MRDPLDFEIEGELLPVIEALQKLPDPALREGTVTVLTTLIKQEIGAQKQETVQMMQPKPSRLRWLSRRAFLYAASLVAIAAFVALGMLWPKTPTVDGLPMLPQLQMPGEKGEPNDGGLGGAGSPGTGGMLIMEAVLPDVNDKMTVYKKSSIREYREFLDDISPSEKAVVPDDGKARELAIAFLKEKGLLPEDDYEVSVGISGVVGFIDPVTGKEVEKATAKTVVLRRKINGVYPDFGSTASVEVGDRNTIMMYLVKWPKLTPVGDYPIITSQEAYERLKRGQTVGGARLNGKIKRVYLAYNSDYDTDGSSSGYLQPVYVFETEVKGTGLMRSPEMVKVAAVQDKYIQKDKPAANQEEKPVDRSKTPKEFSLPEPAKIEVLEKGLKVKKVLTPGDSDFAKYLGYIEKTLIKSHVPVSGSGSGSLMGDWLKDTKADIFVAESGGIHVVFNEKVSISTSLDAEMKLSSDKYENFLIETDDFYLIEDRDGGGKVIHLMYDDGKQWTVQTLDLRGRKKN